MSSPPRLSEPAPPDLTPLPPFPPAGSLPANFVRSESEPENILKVPEESPEETFVADEAPSKLAVTNQYVDKRTPKPTKRPVSYPCGPETYKTAVSDFNVKKSLSDPPKAASVVNLTRGKAQVKPFTKESLERLERKTVQLVREYGFQPKRKLSVEDGSRLPSKFEPFPPALYGRPLEEIDNFIYDEVRFIKNS